MEPAPEIVADPPPELDAVLELLDELELPHAARPNASAAQPTSAPILFLITASPLTGLIVDCEPGMRL